MRHFAPLSPLPPTQLGSISRLTSVLTGSDLERFRSGHPHLCLQPCSDRCLLSFEAAHGGSPVRSFCLWRPILGVPAPTPIGGALILSPSSLPYSFASCMDWKTKIIPSKNPFLPSDPLKPQPFFREPKSYREASVRPCLSSLLLEETCRSPERKQ